jgi:hypothetical protein
MAASFSWASAGDVSLGVANAISAWGSASANSILTNANIAAQKKIRDAQNMERASSVSLAATMRSLQYNAALKNAGNTSNDAAELLARTQQSWTRGNFEMGLRNIEQVGAYAARAAASGVGGASVQQVSYSVRLQQQRVQQQVEERHGQLDYELIKQQSGIMPAAESRLDITPLKPNFDYSAAGVGTNTPNIGLALIQGLLTKGKSLQTALDSIPNTAPRFDVGPTLDHIDTADGAYQPITIN